MGFRKWLLRPLAADTTGDWFVAFKDALEANKTYAGVSVTQENATALPAVYRCVTLNADTVASLPIDCKRRVGETRANYPAPRWMQSPNDYQDFPELIGQLQASLEMDGNAFALKYSDNSGRLAGMYALAPTAVKVGRDENERLVYRISQTNKPDIEVQANAILHIRGFTLPGAVRGLSPIQCLKETIGLGMAAQQFGAQFFGTGATMSGVIQIPGGANTLRAKQGEDDPVEKLREQFGRKHGGLSKSHAIGILTGGAEWKPLSVTPEDSQFLETRKFNAVEIASAFGVPSWLVTDAEGAKGYVTGLYATMYMWLLTGINVRLVRMERAFSRLLGDPSAYIKFNRNAFLTMDPTERAAFYKAGLEGRYLTPNQISALEDMDPYPGGDEHLWSVQWGVPPDQRPTNRPAQAGFSFEGGTHEA